jgi:tetratricopeptide (TPR) repeat protein
MTGRLRVKSAVAALCTALVLATAHTAFAQVGSLRGKAVDESGKPLEGVEVVLDFVGDYVRQFKVTTDRNGEWVRAGMPAGLGTWTITYTKGELSAVQRGVRVQLGEMNRLDPVTLTAGGATGAKAAPAGMSAEEIEKANKRQEQLKAMFDEAGELIKAGKTDEALTKITAITVEVPNCAACYEEIGRIQAQKGDLAEAEKAYLKAIELDATKPAPYMALATIYNGQKRFDESTKMSEKALELSGGGDASAVYNQGIAFWNAQKAVEAQAAFERAIKMDPKMADAHFYLAMTLVNQGKTKEAVTPFQEYLKLAPDGQHAATAKAILDTIK